MNTEKLNELMKIKKKSDANKTQISDFNGEMKAFLKETGYSDEFEKYLFEGFSFAGMKPVTDFMRNIDSDERKLLLEKVLTGKKFALNEGEVSFKVLINMLAFFVVSYPGDIENISKIIKMVPIKAKTKTASVTGNAAKFIEKYFVHEVKENTKFPKLSSMGLQKGEIDQFINVFSGAIESIKPSKKANEKVLINILTWLTECNTEKETINPKNDSSHAKTSEIKDERKPIKSEEMKTFSEMLLGYSKRLSLTAEYITSLEKGTVTLNAKISDLEKTVTSEKAQIEILNNCIKENEIRLSELVKERDNLHDEISSLTDEKNKLESVVSVYSQDKQNSLSEQLNAVASKLKVEYREFKNATEIEMTVELGEIMRDQIANIFKILAKAGIDVESR